MNMFPHLKENNKTYIEHFLFASKISLTLFFRSVIFLLHAVFPFFKIAKKWNIEYTIKKLQKFNKHTQEKKDETLI